MDGYIALEDNFTLRSSESEKTLLDLQTGEKYVIANDQFEFLAACDGSKKLAEISSEYNKASRKVIANLISNLNTIEAIKFSDSPHQRILPIHTVDEPRLMGVQLEATSRCNMKCVHCHQGDFYSHFQDLSLAEIERLVDEMQDLQVENVSLSGGEPLFSNLTFDIANLIEQKDIRISSIFTNGWLIDDDVIKKILSWRSRVTVFVSLDAITTEGMRFRGFKPNQGARILKIILNNIFALRKAAIPVIVNTVMTPYNIFHLDEMYEFMRKIDVTSWRLGFPKRAGSFKQNYQQYELKWEDMSSAALRLIKTHLRLERPFDLQVEFLYRERLFKNFQLLVDEDFICNYEERRESCCIKSNGNVVSCSYCNDMPVGNIRKQSLRTIWYSPQMQSIKNLQIRDIGECCDCELRILCATGCRANAYFLNHEFLNSKDEQACRSVKFFIESLLPVLQAEGILPKNWPR
ncbi:MAG: radical SAM protein [Patescibacteria group bacterium]|nr:radical SAM protein [Patescibacteria group bacterium]